MTPSYTVPGTVLTTGSKGHLVVSELSYQVSRNSTKVVEIPVPLGTRVIDIVNAILSKGQHKYEFDHNGVGCRKWTYDVLGMLRTKRLADGDKVLDAQSAIQKVWPDGTALALDGGEYYE